MKLLSKPETIMQSNAQKRSEIDSGVYLATRIDKLRETLLQLETQQRTFVDNNKRVIEEALDPLIKRKEELEEDLKRMEVKRLALTKPLDDEWKKVKEIQKQLGELEEYLKDRSIICESKVEEADKQLDLATKEFHRAETANATAQELLSDADTKNKQISTKLSDIEVLKQNIEKECSDKMVVLEVKERKLDYDRKHFQDFIANLKGREQEVALREKRVGIHERKL